MSSPRGFVVGGMDVIGAADGERLPSRVGEGVRGGEGDGGAGGDVGRGMM